MLEGYKQVRNDRANGRGGGVLLYISNLLTFKVRHDLRFKSNSAECLCVEVDLPNEKNMIVCVVYRPPNTDVNLFLDDLESLLVDINELNKSVCIMGDYNIDLLCNIPSTLRLRTVLESNALEILIDKPTRINGQSLTLLDNIFVKTEKGHSQSGLFYCEISDHLPVFCVLYDHVIKRPRKKCNDSKHNFDKTNIFNLNNALFLEEWADVIACDNVEQAFELFLRTFSCYFDKYIPLERIKVKKGRQPWITKGILQSIKRRNVLYKRSLKKSSPVNVEKYKKYRNKLTIHHKVFTEIILFEKI